MAKFLEPAGNRIIVIDSPNEEVVLNGISMPDDTKQKELLFGTVVFVGPDCLRTFPKDFIGYGPYAGKSTIIGGTQFRILPEDVIETYVRETEGKSNGGDIESTIV